MSAGMALGCRVSWAQRTAYGGISREDRIQYFGDAVQRRSHGSWPNLACDMEAPQIDANSLGVVSRLQRTWSDPQLLREQRERIAGEVVLAPSPNRFWAHALYASDKNLYQMDLDKSRWTSAKPDGLQVT